MEIGSASQDSVVGQVASQLQIRVGEGTLRVGVGDQGCGDGSWETLLPQKGGCALGGIKPNATHTGSSSIVGPNIGRGLGKQFTKVGGAGMEIRNEPTPVVQFIMDSRSEPDTARGAAHG